MAAFTALVNQQRAATNQAPLGFPNPAIYQAAASQLYGSTFHDVKDASTNLHYPAVTGYDLSTGWGSMNGVNLFNALVNPVLPAFAPAGLTVTSHYQVLTLNWSAATGATSYSISRSTSSSGPFTLIAAGLTATSFQDIHLLNGTTYYYELSAVNTAGQSGYSTGSQAPSNVVPQTPTNFQIIVGGH
jgi:cellulose 1,4-beta-cellobiosidase